MWLLLKGVATSIVILLLPLRLSGSVPLWIQRIHTTNTGTASKVAIKCLFLYLCQKRQTDTAGLHFHAEKACRSALSDVGCELCRDNDIALRWARFS